MLFFPGNLGGNFHPNPLPPKPLPMNQPDHEEGRTSGGFSADEYEDRFGGQPASKQAARSSLPSDDKKTIDIRTGRGFRSGGVRSSLGRQLERASLSGGSLRFLGAKERKFFVDLTKKHAGHLSAGTELPRATRLAMKREIESYRGRSLPNGGTLSATDRQALKGIIDTKM